MTTASIILGVLVFVSMIATAGVLAVGMGGFFQGGDFNRKYGNTLMQWRVIMQFVTLILFAMFLWSTQG
ncbi:twin transmembrane helix small protein [Marinivivus vitaminiproducens]|uniref:twin transmembrane helix small protein n=1 Tax=Marinivivus vitaminiproducens TaxID=3035935 RepID=UPI00279B76B5|nr:twin transmembrane helix small protein [Geminicoccaceae bacterium SCSIO 64248]